MFKTEKELRQSLSQINVVDHKIAYIDQLMKNLKGDILDIHGVKEFQRIMKEKTGEEDQQKVEQYQNAVKRIDQGIHRLHMQKVQIYEEYVQLSCILGSLTGTEALVMNGRYKEKLDYEEIGEKYNISKNYAQKLDCIVINKLLKRLTEQEQAKYPW